MIKKILVVAAHPDDEILGCGGTVAKMVKDGCRAHTLILGEGITSRDAKRDRDKRAGDITRLKEQMRRANKLIGVNEVFACDFPDNRFDEVPLLDIIKAIEKVKKVVMPDIIYTHYGNDLNIDHRITHDAVLTAARPIRGERAKEIYSFEVPSSTEWKGPSTFSPDVFCDISGTLEKKLKAMRVYEGELRDFPHPRSMEGIRVRSAYWGMCSGLNAAEAFKTLRVLK